MMKFVHTKFSNSFNLPIDAIIKITKFSIPLNLVTLRQPLNIALWLLGLFNVTNKAHLVA